MQEKKVKRFKVAVVQMTPVFLDSQATLTKMTSIVEELSKQNCRLILFPESVLPGYPRGLSFGASVGRRTEEGRRLWLRYHEQSISQGDEISKRLADIASDFAIHLVVGVTEKDHLSSSLFCSTFHYTPQGTLGHVHRKVKPTGTERVIWGEGDGSSIRSLPTDLGRIGSLICWENYMPEARMKLYQSGLDLYLAPTADARDSWTASMRHIACESRTYVLSCNQYFQKTDYEQVIQDQLEEDQPQILSRGGSCIVSPYGDLLAGPLYDREGTLTVEIDLDEMLKSRMDFDVVGHYRSSALAASKW